jgi:hypothetical protein
LVTAESGTEYRVKCRVESEFRLKCRLLSAGLSAESGLRTKPSAELSADLDDHQYKLAKFHLVAFKCVFGWQLAFRTSPEMDLAAGNLSINLSCKLFMTCMFNV